MNFYINRDMLLKQHLSSIMQLNTIKKIVLHSSTTLTLDNKQNILPYFLAMTLITGQRPTLSRARKSISNYRLRRGQILGCYVTMTGNNLNNFLVNFLLTLAQVRDFNGLKGSKGPKGSTKSFGIQGYMSFSQLEDNYDIFESLSGFTINCDVGEDVLMSAYGFPIIKSIKK